MGVFIKCLAISFKQRLEYRVNLYIQLAGSLVGYFIQISIWTALIGKSGNLKGVTLADMTNFIILSLIIGTLTDSRIAFKLYGKIRDGSISIDFIRPVNLQGFFYFNELGQNLNNLVFITLPVCLINVLLYGFHVPENPIYILVALLSLFNGIILAFLLNYSLGLTAFWIKDAHYLEWVYGAFFKLFSGRFIPLWFYPPALALLCSFLPFKYVVYTPIFIYLEKFSLTDVLVTLIVQYIWIFLFMVVNRLLWLQAQKIITIHGG